MQFRKRAGLTALLLMFFMSMSAGCASVGTRDSGLITLETTAEEQDITSPGGGTGGVASAESTFAGASAEGTFSGTSADGSAGGDRSSPGSNTAGSGNDNVKSGPSAAGDADALIVVHVCGAVNRAGVYTLDAGSRIYEAVRAAGGFSADADESYINQAQILTDGVRLRIPTTEETRLLAAEGGDKALSPDGAESAGPGGAPEGIAVISGGTDTAAPSASGGASGGLININTADADALCTLSGIGPSAAAKIIDYRQSHGAFKRIEDIMQISGIKEKLFAKIRDHITV